MSITSTAKDLLFYPEEAVTSTKLEVGDLIEVDGHKDTPILLRGKKFMVSSIATVRRNRRQIIEYTLSASSRLTLFLVCEEEDDGISYEFSVRVYPAMFIIMEDNTRIHDFTRIRLHQQLSVRLNPRNKYYKNAKLQAETIKDFLAPSYTKKYKNETVNYGDGVGTSYSVISEDEKHEFSLEYWPGDSEDGPEYDYFLTYYAEEAEIKRICRNANRSFIFWNWCMHVCIIFAIISVLTGIKYGLKGSPLFSEAIPLNSVYDTNKHQYLASHVIENHPITVNRAYQPYGFQVRTQEAPPMWKWAEVEVEVLDHNKSYLYSFANEFWSESGYDDEGRWSESLSDYSAKGTFKTPGTYYLALKVYSNYKVPLVFMKAYALDGSGIPHFLVSFWFTLGALGCYLLKRRALTPSE